MTTLAMKLGGRLPAPIHETAYQLQQRGMLLPSTWAQRFVRFVMRRPVQPAKDTQLEVQQRYDALLERDLKNVERGDYPKSLLFQIPVASYLKAMPLLLSDIPRTLKRMRAGNYKDLPSEVDVKRYPPYFRRNFHWQTDGYFSRRSADIYDVGVEFLFVGAADVMRRQVIPPVSRKVRSDGEDLRLLDVACGTGRMLHQLAVAHPKLRLYGLDLSPYYLEHARDLLADVADVSLLADNAEAMPFRDAYFDVVTSVHLFHELPKPARRNVFAEMWRVLKPGGVLVIQDSAQASESGKLAFFLNRFSRDFHEPFHRCYVEDDIATALTEQGFRVESTEAHFVAKVVIAHKPA